MPKDIARRGSSRPFYKRLSTDAPVRKAAPLSTLLSRLSSGSAPDLKSSPSGSAPDLNTSSGPVPDDVSIPAGYHQHPPQAFYSTLAHLHQQGVHHHYTAKEVSAIVRYVFHQERDTFALQHTRDKVKEVERKSQVGRAFVQRLRTQRAQEKPLLERIQHPTLAERISAAHAAPPKPLALPKPILLDLDKLSAEDILGIFQHRIDATYTRLVAPFERKEFDSLPQEVQVALNELNDKFTLLLDTLANHYKEVTHQQWQSLQFGCQAIGKVSFRELGRNYTKVCSRLAAIYNTGYFDWADWKN